MYSASQTSFRFFFSCFFGLFGLFVFSSCLSDQADKADLEGDGQGDAVAEVEASPAQTYFENISENVLLFPWPEPGAFQRPDVGILYPYTQDSTQDSSEGSKQGRVRGKRAKARFVEHLYFELPVWWDSFYNWQQQPPAASAWPNSPFSGAEKSAFNWGGRSIAMQAVKYAEQQSPSVQLFVYEYKYYAMRPKEYLLQIRRLWQKSETIREIRAPFVQNFGYRDHYAYTLHFMSREYLYVEFILFLQGRAVHFVFQSPHDELAGKSSIAEFHRLSSRTLEQGIYFRNQRVGERF